jgi:hypothetical protein
VIILLDSNLSSPALAASLNTESEQYGCTFRVMPEHAKRFDDDELPEVCQGEGAVALLTNNRHDFSVEVALYQALIEADVSAVVLRLPNSRIEKPDLAWLTARVLKHLRKIIRELENTDQSLLLTVGKDRVRVNRVRDLLRDRLA